MPFELIPYLQTRRAEIDTALEQTLAESTQTAPRLTEAMAYSVMAGGKRLRPILCLAASEAVGGDRTRLLPVACALEMLHTYSLIHDDLPAMDNDTLRRGKATCHVAFDEATAIMAGDALLTLAFETIARAVAADPEPAVAASVMVRIAAAAGRTGMIAGQMRDLAAEGVRLSEAQLEAMHRMKTGAMIESAVHAGAVLGGADAEAVARLDAYARAIGLAFQVVDDLLNVEGNPERLGKAVGTDAGRQKSTYPSLLGIDASRSYARRLVAQALQLIADFDNRSQPLRAIATYIVERDR